MLFYFEITYKEWFRGQYPVIVVFFFIQPVPTWVLDLSGKRDFIVSTICGYHLGRREEVNARMATDYRMPLGRHQEYVKAQHLTPLRRYSPLD